MHSILLAGICCDHNSTYLRGSAGAPQHIRRCLFSGSANLTSENGVDFEEKPFLDLGDHQVEESDEAYLAIEGFLAPHLLLGEKPLILGGDHAVTYPVVRALVRQHGPLSILHFDAHPDLYDHYNGNRYAHACPFARIMEEQLADRLVQVGIRTMNSRQKAQAERFQVEVHEMKDFSAESFRPQFASPLYLSFDMDVLDPGFAPGVSHHEPGGMSVREVLAILHGLDCTVVGADIVEYNPSRDIHDMTAMVAAKLVKEIAAKMT